VRAVVTQAANEMELVDAPEPRDPGPGEVIVRPAAVGICGSDFHFFLGELPVGSFPRIQGHEVGATIEAVGPDCRDDLKTGGRVALWPLSSCGHCYPCRVGRSNVCDNFELIGIHRDGGLQELLAMPQSHVFATTTEPEVAALAEPVSIAVRTLARAQVTEGEQVVVLGAGPIGQAVSMLAAREHGGSVVLVDRMRSRLELGEELGLRSMVWDDREQVVSDVLDWTGGEGAPVVIDATGVADPIRAGVDMAASAGRVVVVGMGPGDVPIRIGSLTEKEVDVLGVSCCGGEEFGEAVSFVEAHGDELARLVSHEFPLDRAPEALRFAMEHPAEVMKVVIK
jgi:threonine dehydrogenase-like Zn-dependent dehydrogenase